MSVNFDENAADEIIQEIGMVIIDDENYADLEWESLSLVINLDDRKSMYGYTYDEDGDATEQVPEESDVIDLAIKFRDVMTANGDEPWKAMMIQITGEDASINIEFDYDGDMWAVIQDDLKGLSELLRPK